MFLLTFLTFLILYTYTTSQVCNATDPSTQRYCLCNDLNRTGFLAMKKVPPAPIPIPFKIDPTNAAMISAALGVPASSIKDINTKEDCMELEDFPDVHTELLGAVPFHRCYLEFTKKDTDEKKKYCVSFMRNYIDKYRFEDFIDYINRGKRDKLLEYALLVGNGATECFADLIEKDVKHKDVILDCFGYFIKKNIILGIAGLLFILF